MNDNFFILISHKIPLGLTRSKTSIGIHCDITEQSGCRLMSLFVEVHDLHCAMCPFRVSFGNKRGRRQSLSVKILSQMSGRSKEEPEINDGDREFLTLARPSFAIDKRES